ncbi:proline rich 11 [Columba livia]|uniref:Proline rich 11 n=1 Tax=Columba livia TaxID=8932 RepID=A0A2I0LYP1_COLLI|nr:proline rich 11 [Columba livia]
MAKYKKRRRKQRARAKFVLEKNIEAAKPQDSVCSSPWSAGDLPLNASSVPSHLSSLWSLALPSVKNVVKPFTTTALLLYCWCQNTVAQSFKVVKDTIFPSQIYLRELNTFREQLERLETEFSRLQGTLQTNGVAALSSENSLCQKCNKPVLGVPVQTPMGPSPISGPSAPQQQPVSAPPPGAPATSSASTTAAPTKTAPGTSPLQTGQRLQSTSGPSTEKRRADADHSQRSAECKTEEDGQQPENGQGGITSEGTQGVNYSLRFTECYSEA